jgi:hypothetical protein
MSRRRNYRAEKRPPSHPWTEAEDAKIVEMTRLGVSNHLWETELPGRRFSEIAERRLELREQGVCPPKPTT